MRKSLGIIFQISAVFIGTIVGAGLASGQEITQFFYYFWIQKFFRSYTLYDYVHAI